MACNINNIKKENNNIQIQNTGLIFRDLTSLVFDPLPEERGDECGLIFPCSGSNKHRISGAIIHNNSDLLVLLSKGTSAFKTMGSFILVVDELKGQNKCL